MNLEPLSASFFLTGAGISFLLVLRTVLFCGLAYALLYLRPSRILKFNQSCPNPAIVKEEIFLTVRNSLQFTFWVFPILFLYSQNCTLIYTHWGPSELLYVPASLILLVLIHDASFYWSHRLMHSKYGRWIRHSVHHKFHNPTPWSALAMSMPEFHMQQLYLLSLFILPLHPLTLGIFLVFSFASNVSGHCGFELWKPKSGLLDSPATHYGHHKHSICNFGLYLTFWDRVMGTDYAKVKEPHPDHE